MKNTNNNEALYWVSLLEWSPFRRGTLQNLALKWLIRLVLPQPIVSLGRLG
jgi:hypothetical protein